MKKIDLAVRFGNLSGNDESGSISLTASRADLDLETASMLFCGKTLKAVLTMAPNGDEKQVRLPGMEDEHPPEVDAEFVVKRFSAGAARIGASLAFATMDVDPKQLLHLAKKSGRLIVTEVTAIAKIKPKVDVGDDGEHPDVAAGKDRPHGHPLLEAAAKGHKRKKGADSATPGHHKFAEICEGVCKCAAVKSETIDVLERAGLKRLGIDFSATRNPSLKGLTTAKLEALRDVMSSPIITLGSLCWELSENPDMWKQAKRWRDADGDQLQKSIAAIYYGIVEQEVGTAFDE